MTRVQQDMKAISLFAPRFFGLLSLLIAALPILDRIIALLPPVLRYRDLAAALATIGAYAVIASDIVTRQRDPMEATLHVVGMRRLRRAPATGMTIVLLGVGLAIVFVRFADPIVSSGLPTTPSEESLGIVLYVAMYLLLALGLWWLTLAAYSRRNHPIQP